MALRVLWDEHETALLIEACLKIGDGSISRKEAINSLSKKLRQRAIDRGIEIDDVYRNENGIALQLMKIHSLLQRQPGAEKHNTKIFVVMVEMYRSARASFDAILSEAKGEERPMKSNEEMFAEWLSEKVSPSRLSDYYMVIPEVESFARKKKIIADSLFSVADSTTTGKIVNALSNDRFFRVMHKRQMKNIVEVMQYYHKYMKENEEKLQEQEHEHEDTIATPESIHQSSVLSAELVAEPERTTEVAIVCETDAETEMDIEPIASPETVEEKGADTNLPESADGDVSSEDSVVDFSKHNESYAFTQPVSVSYFGEIFNVISWRDLYIKVCELLLEDYPDDFKKLRRDSESDTGKALIYSEAMSRMLITPVRIADEYYVEATRSVNDLIRNIAALLDLCRVDYENVEIRYIKVVKDSDVAPIVKQEADVADDPVIAYLEQRGLEYIDYRHKLGCLWIIGGRDITDKMAILHKSGVRMHFRAGGGNVTGGKDAWWTKDTTTEPIIWSDNSATVTAQPIPEEKAPQRCTIQEGRSGFQSWMEANNISNNSAKTAAWALTKVSDIAIEQGITTDPLYTICEAKEVAHILARLEDNNAFQEYWRQNTVALFATRKYAAFRAEQGDALSGLPTPQTTPHTREDGIQSARKRFTEYMLGNKYSLSTARGMTSAVSGVGDYANEHGFLSQSIFLITDYSQLQSFWNRLLNDRDFAEFNRAQNRRFTVAMNHFLTYTKNHGKVSTRSGAASTHSYAPARNAAHPGRFEFEQWLKGTNCPASSVKTYADGVESIGKYLQENGPEVRNIFTIRGIARLEKIRANLLHDKAYAAKTSAGNASLDCYGLKKYIAFRKNDSSGDVDDVSAERFSAILRDNFENGFRINSMIDRNRFKQFYADAYGEELAQADDEIVEILKQIGSIQDDRIFLRESSGQNDLLDDIQAEIAEAFADGISCVYLSELFARHQDELAAQLQVFSSDVLKELLLATSYGAYRSSKHYFYLRDRSPDASADIRKLMQRSSMPMSYSDIYEKLRFIPFDTIRHSLVVTDKMVNVAQETYFYAPNLPVSADELNQIAKLIHSQLQQKSFITDNELRGLIEQHCPSVAINTADFSTWGLRNALAVLLGDSFSFKGAIISEQGEEINMSQAFAEFCRSRETMTLDELRQFAKEMNTVIYWEPVYEEMVRTSQDEFVLKDRVHFDVPATDAVLDELVNGDYQALQNFTLFLHFPVIDIRWNSFVLESYVANYSKDFALLHASYTATDCCGAVVRKDSPIEDFKGLVTDVLARSSQWKTKNDALALLVDKGYLQRKRYSEIDAVIMEANYRRDSSKK